MFANDLFKFDNRLRVDFLGHPVDLPKCDGFTVRYGSEVYTIDSGLSRSPAMIDHLLSIRAEMLKNNPELIDDPSCKLRINCIISHFHADHVAALIKVILLNEFIAVDNVYHGPATKVDPKYNEISTNGDVAYRPPFFEALEKYHPNAKIHALDFGKENAISFTTNTGLSEEATLSLLPPVADWGIGERFDYIFKNYDVNENLQKINLFTVNSACVWLHVRLGKYTFLFTGDTIKYSGELFDEPLDEMVQAYGAEYSPVTVIKYPHHGLYRKNAVDCVLALKPDYIYCPSAITTAREEILEKYPHALDNMKFYQGTGKTLTFSCTPEELVIE